MSDMIARSDVSFSLSLCEIVLGKPVVQILCYAESPLLLHWQWFGHASPDVPGFAFPEELLNLLLVNSFGFFYLFVQFILDVFGLSSLS